jgi:hypothetical protein
MPFQQICFFKLSVRFGKRLDEILLEIWLLLRPPLISCGPLVLRRPAFLFLFIG